MGEIEAAAGQKVGAILERRLAARGSAPDPAQRAAAARLDRLAAELEAFRAARQSRLKRLIAPPEVPRGVYLWGGVGRGKSMLMDAFYGAVAIRRKTRVHFHAFMRDVHEELATLKREADPLATVAARIAKRHRLICFDEFHVSDIADAMILGRLLDALFARGTIFVMTSNYPPDGLYPNGLQRINFLPTIDMIKRRFDVVEVDHGTDYRLRTLEQMEAFLVPADDTADKHLAKDFEQIAGTKGAPGEIEVLERKLKVVRRASGVIWFDFDTLCGGNRSQNDYLEIAREHHTLILSRVPKMSAAMASEARRFTWLVDVLYDHRVKLLVSAECQAYDLYVEGRQASEFHRTVSRLIEMRSRDYLAEAHRVD